MNPAYRLSVVIAVQHSQANLPLILDALDPSAHPDAEFLFCSTEPDPETEQAVGGYENVHLVYGSEGSLIPQLWRDGIEAAHAAVVALGTAHCIPAADWVDRLAAIDLAAPAGVGGVIVNDGAAGARDWAVYLMRYIAFAPPQERRPVAEIAADNAIYRRADIMEHADLLEKGFWEPSFHARFRQVGKTLALDPGLRVTHRNQYTTGQFFRQRLAHGTEFGRARASNVSAPKKWLLIVLSPLLPLLFLAKIASAAVRHGSYKSKLLIATPWLLVFLLAWGLGEAKGYLSEGKSRDKNHAGQRRGTRR